MSPAAITKIKRRSLLSLPGKILLAGVSLAGVCAHVSARGQASASPDAIKIKNAVLRPALKMLKEKKVPFNPQLLLDDQWREELKAAFEQMPEMRQELHVTAPLSGVYFAGTMLMPEQVTLAGDTVIIVHDLAPEDENTTITISGAARLVIFVVGDPKQYRAMRKHRQGELLQVFVDGPLGLIGIPPVLRKHVRGKGGIYPGKGGTYFGT
jgi:hypothetical protein